MRSFPASSFLYPRPAKITHGSGAIVRLSSLHLEGDPIPNWLRRRLRFAVHKAGLRLEQSAKRTLTLNLTPGPFNRIKDHDLRSQSYTLHIDSHNDICIQAPAPAGLQHGVITLCQLLEGKGAGASLRPLRITDTPAYRVRAIQIDMARDFFPPISFLKRIIDRLVDLKLNAIWLYLENHFRAPGMEDLGHQRGLTPDQARIISDYGFERGIDVVPGTNLLSHMEGWLRLERYCDLADGNKRSYPDLTHPDTWPLVRRYIDELAKSFRSPNFHAGFDEQLRTGSNPKVAATIAKNGKAKYFADFAHKVAQHLQRRGKRLWLWDDMVAGRNVYRADGFKDEAPKALAAIPQDAVLVHWWYWGPGPHNKPALKELHPAMIKRVAKTGRPFIVQPTSQNYRWTSVHLDTAKANQTYMAKVGKKYGAFGYACSHWESADGGSFEASWPTLATSAAQGWTGGCEMNRAYLRALSFTICGDKTNGLGDYLAAVTKADNIFAKPYDRNAGMRRRLFQDGPYGMWRFKSPSLSPKDRTRIARHLKEAQGAYRRIGQRDPALKTALEVPLILLHEILEIFNAFDQAWGHYHRASLIEHRPRQSKIFSRHINQTIEQVRRIAASLRILESTYKAHEVTGHTPYDAYVLAEHRKVLLQHVIPLIRRLARNHDGLPYFEKVFYLPDTYRISNMKQFEFKDHFFQRFADCPWPVRWTAQATP